MSKLRIGGSGRVDMGDVVNLHQFRKCRARQEKADKAAENRRKHGRAKSEVKTEVREREHGEKRLDDKRLDDDC
tara:strand:+ start:101 stop:322 length:222 start_codon:yes stop_codon:yes gene_type:complete